MGASGSQHGMDSGALVPSVKCVLYMVQPLPMQRREAFEEIGLPIDRRKVPLLCIVEPFLAGNALIVFPVVVLVVDHTIRPILNAPEVASLFSHPLASLLTSEPPFPLEHEMLELEYHTYVDVSIPWPYNDSMGSGTASVRMHRFLTGREAGGTKPIFGLTASILIRVAAIGYGRGPDFSLCAPGQPSKEERIVHALRNDSVLREAARREGIDPDGEPDAGKRAAVIERQRRKRMKNKL